MVIPRDQGFEASIPGQVAFQLGSLLAELCVVVVGTRKQEGSVDPNQTS